ncbi:hypothetical protein [Acrocarpospora catenulata]|uniref:hypothetical protein n=1 Tax=Acrocarpospora catenulata TaxID=2836182 RepID=UPI001BDB6C4A|nr:hypothetical protein [Acrocarpospora catenulata]
MALPDDAGARQPDPLLPRRTVLILIASILAGLVIGGLSFLGGVPAPLAVVAGLAAAGGTIVGLHALME